jgi:hypothetical protein
MLILLDRVSTWIERIGDLGIRKNVSSDEWRIIYLHCLCWLEDHTRKKGDLKLKRTKQDIEIVVRGRTYSWNQAWKNMKSAGAIGQLPQPGGIFIDRTAIALSLTWCRISWPASPRHRDSHTLTSISASPFNFRRMCYTTRLRSYQYASTWFPLARP